MTRGPASAVQRVDASHARDRAQPGVGHGEQVKAHYTCGDQLSILRGSSEDQERASRPPPYRGCSPFWESRLTGKYCCALPSVLVSHRLRPVRQPPLQRWPLGRAIQKLGRRLSLQKPHALAGRRDELRCEFRKSGNGVKGWRVGESGVQMVSERHSNRVENEACVTREGAWLSS